MQCLHCQVENLSDAVFCEGCGTKLVRSCPQCQTDNRFGSKFCRKCGTSLLSPAAALSPITPPTSPAPLEKPVPQVAPLPAEQGQTEAERRQLTVMFCDLVDSTPLAEELEPEDYREVVRAYQQTCVEVIERFDGYVARYMGDALLVYFGYPRAHEDDAQRAVRTGLGLLTALPALHTQLQKTIGALRALQVRVGLHTGLVVVEDMGAGASREHMAVGETPNIAARLQSIAEPDTVVMSAVTARLVAGHFVTEDLGTRLLKGVAMPVQVYRCLREVHTRERRDRTTRLTPLVGREQEIGLLHERWEHVKEGSGRVVLLSGEAGIGKSRLVQALHEHLVGETQVRIACRCSPYYQNSALYPIIEHLQWLLQWQRSDTPQEKLRKLEEAMALYGFTQQEAVPLLAALLSLTLPEYYTPLALTPQRQKHKTLEILLIWLVREAERRPIRFTMEDLHWVDPSTLDFLSLLIDQAPTIRMLVLLTFRPDFTPPSAWTSRSHVAHIALSRLPRRQVQTMIERMTGGKALPVEILRQLVDKTDGVPLFVEELTRMVLESGLVQEHNGRYEITAPLSSLAIPVTLQDSLMARLDRLSPVKDVVQLAATLGREFSYELIRAVSPLDEVKLQQSLAQLVEAEVLYQRGLPPQATYVFKHTLIQDAAYQSLLRRVRQRYHRQIAHVLVERFPDISSTQPELVAHHYTVAGLHYEAVWYWQQAAQNAINRSANVEAIRHLRQGLAILDALPDTPERAQQELTLQLILGIPLMATQGYTAPEVAQAAARARELCQQLGETSKLLSALSGLFGFHVMRAELQTARELGEQFFQVAQRTQSLPRLLGAHWALGLTLCHLGELGLARDHLEQGIHLYRPQEHRSRAFLHGQDAGVACLSYAGWILGILGYADLARQHTSQALAVAQELSHPFSRAFALAIAALAEQQRREPQAAYAHAQAAVLVSTEEGFPHWLAEGMMVQGWVLVEQGQGPAGIAQIRQGLAAYRATATTLGLPMFLAYLAEACGKVGQVEEGLSVLAEAFDLVETSGERFYAAELHRLKGELLLRSAGHTAEAEMCLQQALALARQQHAKTWELRAAMSLSQLWQQQGKTSVARQLLAEIYDWFKEGFTTADLKAAATLLAELT